MMADTVAHVITVILISEAFILVGGLYFIFSELPLQHMHS